MNAGLRFTIHAQLTEDLQRLQISQPNVRLDFTDAKRKDTFKGMPHKALMTEISNIKVQAQGKVMHQGDITFIDDDLADDFHVWWDNTPEIPARIWELLDLGVRRRLSKHKRWKKDDKVLEFAAAQHERVSLHK